MSVVNVVFTDRIVNFYFHIFMLDGKVVVFQDAWSEARVKQVGFHPLKEFAEHVYGVGYLTCIADDEAESRIIPWHAIKEIKVQVSTDGQA